MFAPEDAAWFRGVNVILHGICSGVLAFWLSQILYVSNTIALVASVILCCTCVSNCPYNIFQSITLEHEQVSHRSYQLWCGTCGNIEWYLFLGFTVCTCTLLQRAQQQKGNDWLSIHKWLVLAMLCGFLAMLSKETGITCLGVCAVQDVFLTYSAWQEES